ncbi:hypothetical protein Poli38472_002507 [Pythium oligandrum]|uniref:PWWP domain-containing protein n=1 Tax=Pythium oligandrum TaxID=41045 RepID=A0A8K1CIV6_PYTOL|nr:hypothetical protein Poli38472_002507 [Pythium oligandrum]|eukprot:TMW63566.1 hypothetical protein Poli38472_002507 [Pythium oligandrum]
MSNDGERPEIPMELGLRVDILDNEGIWNTGRIVDVSRDDDDMVEVKYDGWGDEYNEWVSLAERRLAPLHMFTMVKKCWAKLTKWPWWPAFVVLRAPTCKTAAAALEQETKLYVEFFDSYDVEKRSRCWMQKKNIVSFQEGFDERASKNIGKNFPLFVEGTQRAIAGGSPVLFTGHGTLPIEFSSKYAAPLFQKKLDLVDNDEERWYDAYRVFSDRYKVLYGYEYAVDSVSKVLAVRNAKTGSGKAASGKRVQRDDNDEEDEDEDDDVEIIEDVVAKNNVKKSVKTAPAPARRARDYPAKQPPQSVDDDDMEDAEESEEKEEEPEEDAASDEDDEEEEEDDEEDEDPESPNGRRSARLTKKRKQEEEDTLAARRTTRARRTKGSF